jgi:WD40 repeat protein
MAWPVLTQQNAEVNGVAVSGDGKVVIGGTYFHGGTLPSVVGAYAYDANGAQLWNDVAAPAGADDGVYWVAVSRNGQWAASGGGNHKVPPAATGPLGTGFVNAFEVPTATGNPQRLLNANIGGVNAVALSGDGSYLVAGADATYIFERTGKTFGSPIVLKDGLSLTERQNVVAVAISDDGQRVIYGTTSQPPPPGGTPTRTRVVLYAPALASAPVVWDAPQGHIIKWLAMAANGSGFAVVTTNRPNVSPTSIVCNTYFFSLKSSSPSTYFVNTNAPMWTWPLTGCTGVMSVAINSDGSRVAAVANFPKPGGTKGKVFFFDAQSNTELWVRDTDSGPNSVSMDGDGKLVAVADGFGPPVGKFYLFDAYGASLSLPSQPNTITWSIQLSADATIVAAGTDDGEIYRLAAAPASVPAAPTNVHIIT